MPEPTDLMDVPSFEELIRRSHDRPQVIFKHSLICPTSTWAWTEYQAYLQGPAEGADHWWIPIQNARAISSHVASALSVRHESPQALIVKGGVSVWDASHHMLTRGSLREAIDASTE